MLSCGNNHAVILDDEGNLYGWGFNGKGQLAL
jgi:alpha-tubulin suppressor-like RCC1 family protein